MRIVIDLQSAQGNSKNRGMGRYSLALAQAIARNANGHEVIIVLNGLFPETIAPIREAFHNLLPASQIRIWQTIGPTDYLEPQNNSRRQIAELIREAFIVSLKPDMVYITSLFEGVADHCISSVKKFADLPTAVTLYDLIPYIYPESHLANPKIKAWYFDKLCCFKKADLWLAISNSARQEGIAYLGLPSQNLVNISADANPYFQTIRLSAQQQQYVYQKYGLIKPFVLCGGQVDDRKNVTRLIKAYAHLPLSVRQNYQLIVICSGLDDVHEQHFFKVAQNSGLLADELILTGFIPDSELLALYNLCTLFVFPSWHEGFGLPVLEAMRCGAAVICSNTSSLPEVIGLREATFDPYSEKAIAQKLEQALCDPIFHHQLKENAKLQVKHFSWDESAKKALHAMEKWHHSQCSEQKNTVLEEGATRLKLAYISPLPPEHTGIADFSAELLPALAQYYEVDVIVHQKIDELQTPGYTVRDVNWFIGHCVDYDRVVYHFGNSIFHQHMFSLLQDIPGIIVLHDFFLSSVQAYLEMNSLIPGMWTKELYHAHGYAPLYELFQADNIQQMIWKYPCSLSVIQNSLGVITHSSHALELAKYWYGKELNHWMVAPLAQKLAKQVDRLQARRRLKIAEQEFIVCSFGMINATKLNHRLLNVWLQSSFAQNARCKLIFIGENERSEYGKQLRATINQYDKHHTVFITDWIDIEHYQYYLAAADIAVQLRTLSRGETSRGALECLSYGIATIVNANGSMAELPPDAIWMLPDQFSDSELLNALQILWQDPARRTALGRAAQKYIRDNHQPSYCAKHYYQAIEHFYQNTAHGVHTLLKKIANLDTKLTNLTALACAVSRNCPPVHQPKQILFDISIWVQYDNKTGIERAVRSLLKEWLFNPPPGYRVEPIYAYHDRVGYRYARKFTTSLLGCPIEDNHLSDDPIDYYLGDIFFGAEFAPSVVTRQRSFYQTLRNAGIQVYFTIHDVLCLTMPQYFLKSVVKDFSRWLEVVLESDGVLCPSETVRSEVLQLVAARFKENRTFQVHSAHWGAEVADPINSSKGLPTNASKIINKLSLRPTLLMVSTLEPRKGHDQVLAAVEILWQKGGDINLVIVGKQGWLVERLTKYIRIHPKRNKYLFWLEGISDEYLAKIYSSATCLVAASYNEGFGLPLIEAAHYKLPIIARDIPIFREVAGDYAYYFTGTQPEDLAIAIEKWLILYNAGIAPSSENMPWLTWKQSAQKWLHKILLSQNN